MNRARFYFFQPVRFLADIDDLTHSNVPSLQQAYSLPSTWLSLGIGTLRPRMEGVFTQDIAVYLDACDAPTSMETLSHNPEMLSGVLASSYLAWGSPTRSDSSRSRISEA